MGKNKTNGEMQIYNKGKRKFETQYGDLNPEKSIMVPEEYGKQMISGYPRDIINAGDIVTGDDMTKRIRALEARERAVAEKEAALNGIQSNPIDTGKNESGPEKKKSGSPEK